MWPAEAGRAAGREAAGREAAGRDGAVEGACQVVRAVPEEEPAEAPLRLILRPVEEAPPRGAPDAPWDAEEVLSFLC